MLSLAERRRIGRTYPRLWSRNVLVNWLRLVWIVILLWCEVGAFFWSMAWCRWPDTKPVPREDAMHIMLIADAQVRHRPRGSSRLRVVQDARYHSYLKRGWNAARRLQPHAVIFMGDMLSSGRSIPSRNEYSHYHNRFRSLFSSSDRSVATYHIPGNEDVGLSTSPHMSKTARHRYLTHFGPLNQQVTLQNHTFVLLDAPGLVEEDYLRAAHNKPYSEWTPLSGGPIELVKSIPPNYHQPVIVLTHIPLFRPETASCGPLRERGTIRRGAGDGYQSTLGKQTSAFLLETLRPAAIYSADDRDHCEYLHRFHHPGPANSSTSHIREVTIKSFSPTRHIRKPGFQLLSIVSPSQSSPSALTIADSLCLLPNHRMVQSSIYASTLVLTILFLCFSRFYLKNTYVLPSPPPIDMSSLTSPQRTIHEDEHRSLTPPLNSATWTHWLPTTPISATGNGDSSSILPQSIRTPNSLAPPQLRASCSPIGPHGSPLIPPMMDNGDDDDDQGLDMMRPSQYATRTGRRNWRDWPTHSAYEGEDGDDANTSQTSFFRTPRSKSDARMSWSWAFVFRGRRRRMTIRAPTLPRLSSLVTWLSSLATMMGEVLTVSDSRIRRRTFVAGVLADAGCILWPVVLVWTLYSFWTLRGI